MDAVSASCSAIEGDCCRHLWLQLGTGLGRNGEEGCVGEPPPEVVTVTEKGQPHNLGSASHVHLLSELGKSPKQRAIMNFSQESHERSFLDAALYHTPHLYSHLN